MNQNPFGGKRVTANMDKGLSGNPTGGDQSGQLASHTMGMYRGGGVAQPSLGDLGAMLSGRMGAPLPVRDDDADQVVAAQQ